MIKIRKYESSDKDVIVELENELKDYVVGLDQYQRLRRLPNYGEIYIGNILDKINKLGGVIFIAEVDEVPVGMIIGVLQDWTAEDEAGCVTSKPAEILDLIVSEKYRSQNIGALLMKEVESYFKEQGCDVLYLDLYASNKKAYDFYKKLGYHEDTIMMEKIIK